MPRYIPGACLLVADRPQTPVKPGARVALHKEVPPFGLPVKKSLYMGRLCRPFLALLHGLIVGHIFLFQRFRLWRCPKTDGTVVDVYPLMPLAVYLFRAFVRRLAPK